MPDLNSVSSVTIGIGYGTLDSRLRVSDKAEARAVFTELLEKSGKMPGAVVSGGSWNPVSVFGQRNSVGISFFDESSSKV